MYGEKTDLVGNSYESVRDKRHTYLVVMVILYSTGSIAYMLSLTAHHGFVLLSH